MKDENASSNAQGLVLGEGEEPARLVFMDYVSGKPVDPRVLEAMEPYHKEIFGNPSSLHLFGDPPVEAMEEARKKVADLIGAKDPREIVFTSGATESNNLALKGVAFRNQHKGNHIIISAVEHISIINVTRYLEKFGFETTRVGVDKYGVVELDKLEKRIRPETLLISVNYANSEIGTIEPIREISEIAHEHNVLLHVDAVAAEGLIPIDVQKDGIDLLTLSSNDIYGPRGVGGLYVRTGVAIEPIIHGGGQERGLRSGTESIPGMVGMGKAAEIAKKEMQKESSRLQRMRDRIINTVLDTIGHSYLNGHPTQRVPNNAHFRFDYIEGEAILLGLNMNGIAVSTGSACAAKRLEPSHVLIATGLLKEEAHGSLELTLGRYNTEEDVDYFLEVLPQVIDRLRELSPLTPKDK
ncbi:MAG: cysteine desulfurase family protein [Candidatus Freyrarchaeum guaymaensis]